jgi:hypothetical protein|eukprot:COSAG02_NODE_1112_length_14506_cov_31.458944_5_plen_161_part_00
MPASCGHGGDHSEPSSSAGDSPCVPSMATALGKLPGTLPPKVLPGCLDTSCSGPHPIDFTAVKEAAKTADAVIMALGLCGRPKIFDADDHSRAAIERSRQQVNNDGTEGEGHDRTSISCVPASVCRTLCLSTVASICKHMCAHSSALVRLQAARWAACPH